MTQTTVVSTKSLPAMITCECGQILNRMSVQDAFGVSVDCDNCEKTLKPSKLAYHCSNQHCYCLKCSGSLLLNVNNKGLMKPIHCACQQIMVLTLPDEAYATSASCNNTECRAKIGLKEYCYHCPTGVSSVHPKGFDYCMKCARQQSMVLLHRSALLLPRNKIQNESVKASSAYPSISSMDIAHQLLPKLSNNEHVQQMELNAKNLTEELHSVSHDYELLRDAILRNIKIACICNAQLSLTKPNVVYPDCAVCDNCGQTIQARDILFHCPKGKSSDHSAGFDICLNCAIGNKRNYKTYERLMQKQCAKLKRFEKIIKPEILTIFEQNANAIQRASDTVTQAMPYVMDVQQIVFKQLMKRVNGEEAIPGSFVEDEQKSENEDDENVPLLNDDDRMQRLSLKQLHQMRRLLNECIIKHEDMETIMNQLNESINCKINDMESEWESWDAGVIVDWIILLDNGRFAKYEEILRKELYDGDAKGKILPALDISDWRKSFAITNWDDAIALNKYKNILVTNKREEAEEAAVHEYPSPFDPAEEGAETGAK